uniref:Translation initiation factor-3 n=1 Tax=Lutzomyia longipalpis TaxID=7200 RepID=A0A1B0FV17_LUTLO
MYRLNWHLKCLKQLTGYVRPVNNAGILGYATKKNTADDVTATAGEKVDKGQKNQDKLKPKITLLGPDSSTTIVTLEEAQKISKRREMKLIKVMNFDTKTQRPTYRLMTNAEFKEEQLKSHVGSDSDEKNERRDPPKGEKLLQVNNKIGDHDLQARIKNVTKWLSKNNRVVVVISGAVADAASSEKIFREIENATKSAGNIVQKRGKGSDIRFQINPTPSARTEDDIKAAKIS